MNTKNPSNFPREKPETMGKVLNYDSRISKLLLLVPDVSACVQSKPDHHHDNARRMTQAQYNDKDEGGDQAPILQLGI